MLRLIIKIINIYLWIFEVKIKKYLFKLIFMSSYDVLCNRPTNQLTLSIYQIDIHKYANFLLFIYLLVFQALFFNLHILYNIYYNNESNCFMFDCTRYNRNGRKFFVMLFKWINIICISVSTKYEMRKSILVTRNHHILSSVICAPHRKKYEQCNATH